MYKERAVGEFANSQTVCAWAWGFVESVCVLWTPFSHIVGLRQNGGFLLRRWQLVAELRVVAHLVGQGFFAVLPRQDLMGQSASWHDEREQS